MTWREFSRRIVTAVKGLKAVSAAAEDPVSLWLCDNRYLLVAEGASLLRNLPKLRRLPRGGERVISLAADCVKATFGRVDEKTLTDFLRQKSDLCHRLTAAEFDGFSLCLTGQLLLLATDPGASVEQVSSAIGTLREGGPTAEALFAHCPVDGELMKDPTGAYAAGDEATRSVLRKRVARLARREGRPEGETVANLVSSGTLYGKKTIPTHRRAAFLRGMSLAVATFLGATVVTFLTGRLSLGFLCLLPVYAIVLPVADTVTLTLVPASRLLRLDPERGIPEGGETAVVVSCLLTDPKETKECFDRLLRFSHADRDPRLMFGLLADLPDADRGILPGDRAVIRSAVREWERVNASAPGRFFLFLRKRTENADGRYTGKERKRGALLDFMGFLRGTEESGITFRGDKEELKNCQYVLTLDSDTELTVGGATTLACIACHPENRPVMEKGKVMGGHGMIVPRVVTALGAGDKTPFARAVTGQGGATAYSGDVGDLYQDLYHTGLYAGKGLLHVDTALALLPGALPDGKILSHDIPEGCLLRAGVAGDVELTDGCPATSRGYLKRLHRWTRGDVQNLCLLVSSRFDGLSKRKLLDNVRRALTPVLSLLLLLWTPFLPLPAALTLLTVGVASLIPGDLWTLITRLGRLLTASGQRAGASPALSAARRAGLNLLMAGETGLLLLDAMVTALWRSLVTKRNLMEWSTASQTDKKGTSCLRGAFLGGIWTLILFLFPVKNRLVLPLLLLWLIAPLCMTALDRPRKDRRRLLPEEEQDTLREYAASMWRFFEENLTEKRGYLPPDNIQVFPVADAAERTSPTNIGLMLLSVVAARDLELIDSRTMTDLLCRAVETIEQLPKERGNLYNWYDLKDRSVLSPRYLSSVDSGNFLCCLMALRQGVKDYLREDRRLWDLFPRLDALIENTDLSIFADNKRGKLLTGIDGEGNPSRSAYDLLMSEALLTVCVGVTRGQLPLRVYRLLGRLCGKQGGETGALSWTGTMFEYFMPTLLLPVYEGSFLHHSLRFCLRCQKDRVKGTGLPWGISESGFYGFDPTLHYKYRAHGVQRAALCRGQDADLVLSPYSTFLTLTIDPEGAMDNLKRLKKRGMLGEYGFFEALDATPSRTGGETAPVQSFMAHHVGMSLVAAANCLCGDVFVRRFTADPTVAAGLSLLQEKLPDAVPVYRGHDDKRGKRPPRMKLQSKEYDDLSPVSPRAGVLASDKLTAVFFDTGDGFLTASTEGKRIHVTARGSDPLQNPTGLFCLLKIGGKVLSVGNAPIYGNDPIHRHRQVKFAPGEVTYYAHGEGLDVALSVTLSGEKAVGIVRLTVKNLTAGRLIPTALLYTEPMLCLPGEEVSHRAFAKLFLSLKKYADGVVFSRRPGRVAPPLSLAICRDRIGDVSRLFEREKLLRRPEGTRSLGEAFHRKGFRLPADDCGQEVSADLCATVKLSLSLPPRGQKSVCWAFALNKDGEEAMREARETLRTGFRALSLSAAEACRNRTTLAGLDSMGVALAAQILPCLFRPSHGSKVRSEARRGAFDKKGQYGDERLWSVGLSGEEPILLVELGGSGDERRVKTFLSVHRYLSLSGVSSDLVFLVRDRHEYGAPVTSAVRRVAASRGLDWELGRKGGVFPIDVTDREELRQVLCARAAYFAQKDGLTPFSPGLPFAAIPVCPVSHPAEPLAPDGDDRFTVDPRVCHPHRPWCHVLANAAFGTLLSDRSVGHTWFMSSRENRLTDWSNDPCADLNAEAVLLDVGNKRYRLTDGAAVIFTKDNAVYRGRAGDVHVTVTVDLVERLPVKRVSVTLSSLRETPFALSYFTSPAPDGHGEQPLLRQDTEDGVLLTTHLTGQLFPGVSFLFVQGMTPSFSTDKAAFLSGRPDGPEEDPPYACSAVTGRGICRREEQTVTFYLGHGGTRSSAMKMVKLLRRGESVSLPPADKGIPPRYQTGEDGLDRLLNTFLPKQIVDCRLLARTAFWQSSGACGFRDQLQDICAAVTFAPKLARQQILRAACRQFEEGDVFHWWIDRGRRPPFGSRTTCSDDLLWLPYSVERYLSVTGDRSILAVKTPFLTGELPGEAGEKGMVAGYGSWDTVTEHCLRAIRRAHRLGRHGLVLMGVCDWNDGLSNVGVKGRGETVWGTMFLSLVCRRFAPVCDSLGMKKEGEELRLMADKLDEAWKATFDGDRYLRAYDDEGNPMGRAGDKSMAVDLLPQSFAAILYPEEENSRVALQTVLRELVDEEAGIIKLFDPPFDAARPEEGRPSPGYVAAYPPGVRENGGQYTHGALWFLFALARTGQKDLARRLADRIRPDVSYEKAPEVYGGEPYYVAADVSGGSRPGRAGWTMYTGAAGWMYRLYTEELL